MNTGFIYLHRTLLDWEWYDDHPTFKLFIHCLLKANHTQKKWRGITIKRGEFITSLTKLSSETGLSVQQVRTSLKKLEKTNEVTHKATKLNTCITVNNYDDYQHNQQTNNTVATKKQHSSNTVATTTNNDNNDNNDNKTIPEWSEFLAYALEKKPKVDKEHLKHKYDSWVENDWCVNRKGKKEKIKNWKSTLSNTLFYIKQEEPQQASCWTSKNVYK